MGLHGTLLAIQIKKEKTSLAPVGQGHEVTSRTSTPGQYKTLFNLKSLRVAFTFSDIYGHS